MSIEDVHRNKDLGRWMLSIEQECESEPPASIRQEIWDALYNSEALRRAALKHGNPSVRIVSAKVVMKLAVKDAQKAASSVQDLINLLDDGNPRVRDISVQALANMAKHSTAAIPVFIRMLKQEVNEETQDALLRALGNIGPPANAAAPVIFGILKDEVCPSRVRARAARALGTICPKEMASVLKLMDIVRDIDQDESLRAAAVGALQSSGTSVAGAKKVVSEALGDARETVRVMAVLAFKNIEQDRSLVVAAMEKALQDEAMDVRRVALSALRGMNPRADEAVLSICMRLRDEQEKVRVEAVMTLSYLNINDKVIAGLRDALSDPVLDVREAAAKVLAIHAPKDMNVILALLTMLKTEKSPVVRVQGVNALGSIGVSDEGVVRYLLDALTSDVPEVRSHAAKAIDNIFLRADCI